MRTVRRRIYAAHLTVCRGIIEQLEQVEIDAFPTAFVTTPHTRGHKSVAQVCGTSLWQPFVYAELEALGVLTSLILYRLDTV
jgi:hypothetical protein